MEFFGHVTVPALEGRERAQILTAADFAYTSERANHVPRHTKWFGQGDRRRWRIGLGAKLTHANTCRHTHADTHTAKTQSYHNSQVICSQIRIE